jgi:hypothetical protein
MNSYLLTEENLIGSLGNAILHLKQIKEGTTQDVDTDFFNKLIDFFEKANNEDYQTLLYDKYFIVSEEFLGDLHKEFMSSKIINDIDFLNLKKSISTLQSNKGTVDELRNMLKTIVLVLLKNRNYRQAHL